MSKQPTNGPYHWGNGPKPQRNADGRKISTHGCFATVLAFAAVLGAVGYGVKEILS